MNTKQRFLNALRGLPVDRPPVAAVTTGITVEMMERVGIFWPEAHSNADQLAGLAESIHLCTETECIKLPFDMAVEVEALGAQVDYRTVDTLPTELGPICASPDELVLPDDFLDRGRVPTVLAAISRLRKRYDSEIPIVTSIVGPFTLAEKVFGFETFLTWLIDSPDWVHQVMAKLTDLALLYAQAQIDAGSDTLTLGEAGCSGHMISAKMYNEFVVPYHKRLTQVSVPTIMHICGRSTGHTRYLAETGTTAYNFDEGVDLKVAVENLKGKVVLIGSVPTIPVLLQGTPEEVYRSSTQCLENGVDVLCAGCAMAPHTPLENIAAMVSAGHDWGRRVQAERQAGGLV